MRFGADLSQRSRPWSNKVSFTLVLPTSSTATAWLIVQTQGSGNISARNAATGEIFEISAPDSRNKPEDVKGFGCRSLEGRRCESGGRRPKASKGGNRAKG